MSLDANSHEPAASLVRFLIELRSRLMRTVIVLLLIFSVLAYFANQLYSLLSLPLLKFLPAGHLIATQLVSPFFVPFKLAFTVSLILTVPYFLYQFWAFVAPALYGHERRLVWPFLFISVGLFYAGISFAYFVMFPALFHFLAGVVPPGVQLMPDMGEYLNFTTHLLVIFGALFEIPVAMVLFISVGVVTRDWCIAMRSYAIVGAFVLGMLLAPPDVVSQTLLAMPIWLLYESGILLSRFFVKKIT